MSDLQPYDPIIHTEVQAPHSREAEEAVLGAVLINPEAYYDIAQFLQPDDFFIVRNRWIWETFTRLHETRTPIDFLTVCEQLEQRNQIQEVGGAAYIMTLINQTPTSLHASAYGHIVEDNSIRRRMLASANELAKLAYDRAQTVDTLLDEAEKSIFGLSERRVRHDLQPIQQVLGEVYDRVDQLSRRTEDIYGVPTGLIDLDRLLGGLQKSDLLIVAGRPGMGKTGFLLSIAKNAAQRHKKHVAMFSLEMSNEQLVQRLIAQETGIDTQRLRSGKLTEEEWPLFTHAIEVLADTHIYLDDTPAITPLQLRTKCRRLHMEYELDLVIVDYLQLMSSDTRNDNRVQEVSFISRNLKVLARELNVPVLTAAQLSRAVEQRADKRPVLSDLRESGCLTGETLVTLASGELKPIRSLVGEQPDIVTIDENLLVTKTKASRVWLTGHRPVYKMATKSGRWIRATGNHPFLTISGWKALDELGKGERIALPRYYPEPEMAAMRGTSYGGDAHFGFAPTRTVLKNYAALLEDENLEKLAQSDLYWDTIVSIELDGEEDVFDITVPETHNFIANGIVVHNSLEQDADIVMFIHRPDMMEKDSPRQNIAEIIVSKHRNGPTHPGIEMIFLNNLARFENAATPNRR
jgi:replicative DNA helicase